MILVLSLIGPVELTGPGDIRLTPRGMRARGALAIMGTARGMRLHRARLQDLLFSDREPEHGNASLRQVLREIRIALGDHRQALITGPGWVGLDPEMLRVDMRPRPGADGQLPEFGADLDIPDPEFEDWLRDARQAAASHPETPDPAPDALPALILQEPISSSQDAQVIGGMILSEAAGRVGDLLPVEILSGVDAAEGPCVIVKSMANMQGDTFNFLVMLTHQPSGRMMWSQRFSSAVADLGGQMGEFVARSCLGMLQVLDHGTRLGAALQISFGDVFSFSTDRLRRADDVLARLGDSVTPAVTLSLRAWIRTTHAYERLDPNPGKAIAEAAEFAARARQAAPYHATALAVSSVVEAFLDRDDLAFELSRQAVVIDSQNPLARLAHSRALAGIGRNADSAMQAQQGLTQALSSINPANWHLGIGVALMRAGDLPGAMRHLEAVHRHAPDNRPALRFLSALRFATRDEAGAAEALRALKKLEPDFSLDLMASEDYPVDTLRRLGLLGIAKSGLF
ncbi:SARP family transcriptional regulator [Paracoccus sp. 1_MG-2023]|uniref:AfsR/SARP family transcriptional regulator n=1 Tax=unclassified Paracoccus (in: a-proteobacteria) TaxID=2688777 RepID=UPI001C08B1B8|nr:MULTISPECIES: SARP family transcriptional regulator [unclassified Paracoccus (in: a-proteobacteria)]MBU2957223.1 SARP family transcriptional regulator [Paracoccus sp. C2R09]MDO6669110.1 SARP family transcriptional regulator [Paracoccus sp. 1_MG-2023]